MRVKRDNLNLDTKKQHNPVSLGLGYAFAALALIVLTAIFYPTIKLELGFKINPPDAGLDVRPTAVSDNQNVSKYIVAADPNFSIVIPKIGANAKVIKDVDPYNSKEYQKALTQGVAHAKGTALPGRVGNTFIFAHSSDSFINANRYNSVFYLINKLENDDKFYLVYNKVKYTYKVTTVKVVPADDISYLKGFDDEKSTATLMTCWPAGTTLKRLVVVGALVK